MNTKSTTNKTCWICGAEATTGEHIVKNKLLKTIFSENPKLVLHYEDGRKKIARSTNNKLLKPNKNLCLDCNSSLTQPFDRAYDKFIGILVDHKPDIINNKFINLEKFTKLETDYLFRYFAKEFGCKIYNEGLTVPNVIKDMMQGKQYGKNLMLFFYCCDVNSQPRIELSHIDEWKKDTNIVIEYHFSLGWLTYLVLYTNLSSKNIKIINTKKNLNPWHGKSKKIYINTLIS